MCAPLPRDGDVASLAEFARRSAALPAADF